MSKFFKWVGIVVIAIIALSVIANLFSGKKDSVAIAMPTEKSNAASAHEKAWVTVYTFKGNGKKKSPNFELTGNDAKLQYSYTSESDMGGMFAAYVVDKGEDIMKTGGFPEVMVTKSETGESALQKTNGQYYLDVNAVGNWTITVTEFK